MNTYLQLKDKHKGEICAIVGAGPSLYYNLHNSTFFSLCQNNITIAVNSAIMINKSFNYFVSCDYLSTKWSWFQNVLELKGEKIVRSSWEKYKDKLDGFLYFEPRETSEGIIDVEENALCYCSSMAAAIDLSIQVGFKKIFIFGLDHNEFNGNDHFWQFFPIVFQPKSKLGAQWNWQCQQRAFPTHLQAYEALKGFAESKRVEIYNVNCSFEGEWITKVDVFEKIEVEEVKERSRRYYLRSKL